MPLIELLSRKETYRVVEFGPQYGTWDERTNFLWHPVVQAVRVDGVIVLDGKQVTSTYYAQETLSLDMEAVRYNGAVYDMGDLTARPMFYDALKTELSLDGLDGE